MARSTARRCSATNRDGSPCRQNPQPGSDPLRRMIHAGVSILEEPPPGRRCTATNRAGTRCLQHAAAGTDPPLCHHHARAPLAPARASRLHGPTARGDRCPSWSLRDSDLPPCATQAGRAGFPLEHTYSVTYGFYISRLLPADIAGIEAEHKALDEGRLNLDVELFLCRYLVTQLMIATRPERLPALTVRQIVRYINLILRLLKTISIILAAKREIEGLRP